MQIESKEKSSLYHRKERKKKKVHNDWDLRGMDSLSE